MNFWIYHIEVPSNKQLFSNLTNLSFRRSPYVAQSRSIYKKKWVDLPNYIIQKYILTKILFISFLTCVCKLLKTLFLFFRLQAGVTKYNSVFLPKSLKIFKAIWKSAIWLLAQEQAEDRKTHSEYTNWSSTNILTHHLQTNLRRENQFPIRKRIRNSQSNS